MYRTIVLAASIAALSVPAFASEITVSLAGKTKAQVVAEIHHAATTVCINDGYTHLSDERSCANAAEAQAMLDLEAIYKAKPG